MVWSPQVCRLAREGRGERLVVGHRLVDEFLESAASRARPNTLVYRATLGRQALRRVALAG